MGLVELSEPVVAAYRRAGEQALGEALVAAERWRWPEDARIRYELAAMVADGRLPARNGFLDAVRARIAAGRALRAAPASAAPTPAARTPERPGARGRRRRRRG